jgi:antitoxin HicB
MQIFEYRARFEPGERKGTLVVSFPDVPEAITEGKGEAQARANAEDALGLALLSYPQRGLALPKPRARGAKLVSIAVEPEIAAKLALLEAIRERGLSKSAFARLIGRDEKEVRRILDPRHSTKLSTLSEALRALGQQMVIKTERLRELVPA